MERYRPCEFYIEPKDDYRATALPRGFHIEGDRRCPRNLPPEQAELAQPNGTEPCLLFDLTACEAAFSEEYHCPVRRGKREQSQRKNI